jgi:hypothetical protein
VGSCPSTPTLFSSVGVGVHQFYSVLWHLHLLAGAVGTEFYSASRSCRCATRCSCRNRILFCSVAPLLLAGAVGVLRGVGATEQNRITEQNHAGTHILRCAMIAGFPSSIDASQARVPSRLGTKVSFLSRSRTYALSLTVFQWCLCKWSRKQIPRKENPVRVLQPLLLVHEFENATTVARQVFGSQSESRWALDGALK